MIARFPKSLSFRFLATALAGGILILLVKVLPAGSRPNANGESAEGLVVHLSKSKLRLDPHLMDTAPAMTVTMQLYRGLLRLDPNGDCVPDLALGWTESADHRVYRFKLREAFFSNGERITGHHVQFSFARAFWVGAGIAADIDYISGHKEFLKSGDIRDFGVKVISDDEVEFHLSYPSALFLKHMAVVDCAIMPFDSIEKLSGPARAFSGPYKIDGPMPDGDVEAEKIDLIKWRSDPFDSLTPPRRIRFLNSQASVVELALKGQVDTLDNITIAEDVRATLEKRGWGATPTELTWERFIVLNAERFSFELRNFLYGRVNPAEIARSLGDPALKPAYGLIPNGFPGELGPDDLPRIDEPLRYDGPAVTIHFDFNENSDFDAKVARHLNTVWSHPRIRLVLNPLPPQRRLERTLGKKSDAVLARKGIDYPDGYSVLTYFKGKYDANHFFVDDPRIDAAISNTIREFDPVKRTRLYKDVQIQILELRTVIPLIFGSQASGLWSEKVISVPSHPMGLHTVPFETIEMRARVR